jgi:3-methyl-2-oxobutanoate hydroxymethyltransferase
VFEAIPAAVADAVVPRLTIPVIGIGAGVATDGQVLVWHDLLGLYEGHAPRFVKQYTELATLIGDAVERYATDVRDRSFPEDRHAYTIAADELALFEERLAEVLERA